MTTRPLRLLVVAALAAGGWSAGAQVQRPLSARPEATASPHGDIAAACQACHTAEGWRPLRPDPAFDHARDAGYPLEASHAQATCASCHLGLRFTGLENAGADCGTCHLDVHAGALGPTCQSCHEPTDWALVEGVGVHAGTAFPLTGAHLGVSCDACHADDAQAAAFAPLSTECLACHADDRAATESGLVPHLANAFSDDCATCHHTTAWSAGPFEHSAASGGFPLLGAHQTVVCSACHAPPGFAPRFDTDDAQDCVGCHAADAAAARVNHTSFPETCTTCHNVDAWQGASGDHAVLSGGFGLVGAHLDLDCGSCHRPDLTPRWDPASQDDCVACHANDVPRQPDHDDFPDTCATCHTTSAWPGATIDHPALSGGFALQGAHLALDCSTCHSEPGFGLPWDPAGDQDCATCHADDADRAEPDHDDFPTTCTTCHSPEMWQGATVDHPALSGGFNLVGAHVALDCSACHSEPGYGVPWMPTGDADCVACHADDASRADPPHDAFPETCTTCHSPEMWGGATVDHPALSGGFALLGAHLAADCAACHSGPDFGVPWSPATQDDCVACHAADYDGTAGGFVDHVALAFPTECATCHGLDMWEGAQFDHVPASGGFGLVGAHLGLACAACHSGLDREVPWDPASQNDCVACHASDASSAQPPHDAFPATCATCHTPDTWTGATVDHPALSDGFELIGAHLALDCAACHSGPDFEVPWNPDSDADCVACHADDADRAALPHDTFPETCTTCHDTSRWPNTSVDHPGVSGGFALVGAHLALDCATCHSEADGSPPWSPDSDADCVSCHADDADAATPDHAPFPTTCTECHGVDTWQGATVDHPELSGGFDLVGAHLALACEACHSGPGGEVPWDPTSDADCVACHADDAANAELDHGGFSTTCTECHTTDTWQGATFDHDAFPIYSGRHEGEWASCQTCHIQPSDFSVFSCVTCHEHNQAEMDDRHDRVPDYVYESTACYACHPDGEKDFGLQRGLQKRIR